MGTQGHTGGRRDGAWDTGATRVDMRDTRHGLRGTRDAGHRDTWGIGGKVDASIGAGGMGTWGGHGTQVDTGHGTHIGETGGHGYTGTGGIWGIQGHRGCSLPLKGSALSRSVSKTRENSSTSPEGSCLPRHA